MGRSDDNIRRLANESLEAERQRNQARLELEASGLSSDARWKEVREASARRTMEREAAVLELCGRFAVWGTKHDIPYNSPSIFARGWLLGDRLGEPTTISVSFNGAGAVQSNRSLLVNRASEVYELVVHHASTPSRRNHYPFDLIDEARFRFPVVAEPARYHLESIEKSIADFSFKHEAEW